MVTHLSSESPGNEQNKKHHQTIKQTVKTNRRDRDVRISDIRMSTMYTDFCLLSNSCLFFRIAISQLLENSQYFMKLM